MANHHAGDSLAIGVIGAGSWGTALADLLATKGHAVTLWARKEEIAASISKDRRNPTYLTEFQLAENLRATHDYGAAVAKKAAVVFVTPSQVMREMLQAAKPFLDPKALLVCCSKGIERGTLRTMNEVFGEILPPHFQPQTAFLSGPSFAREVMQKSPTAITAASMSLETAERVQQIFSTDFFRPYTSNDVIGVELSGSLKNVIAIASGISDGLGFGHNSRAALITRGLGEIARLGNKRGAQLVTFLGLAGMGDLLLTCTSRHSRNYHVGFELGKGRDLKTILSEMKMIAEGVETAASAFELAAKEKVEMIICERVYDILYRGANPRKVVHEIMTRALKPEFPWVPKA